MEQIIEFKEEQRERESAKHDSLEELPSQITQYFHDLVKEPNYLIYGFLLFSVL